jgi:hypothetical protein
LHGEKVMSGGGTAPNGNTSNLPLFGTPEQQMADPLGLFPGTPPQQGGPSSLPNMGINPLNPKGAFNTSVQSQGSGPYNNMAAQAAGPLFNPGANQNPGNMAAVSMPASSNTSTSSGSKGAPSMSSIENLPGIGGGNGKLINGMLSGGATNVLGGLGGLF